MAIDIRRTIMVRDFAVRLVVSACPQMCESWEGALRIGGGVVMASKGLLREQSKSAYLSSPLRQAEMCGADVNGGDVAA